MIYTAAEIHHVTSPEAYRALAEKAMAKRRRMGFVDARTIEVDAPAAARVNHGRWVIDCDCGASNAVHPEWSLACCLACGAIRTRLVMPTELPEVEEVLTLRPREHNRNWRPGESVAQLKAENVVHKLPPERGAH